MKLGQKLFVAIYCLMADSTTVLASHESDVLAVVVPANSAHRVIDLEMLNEIYRRKRQYWDDGLRIEPVNLPSKSAKRILFSQQVLRLSTDELESYWGEMYFHGIMPPHVLSSEEAVLRFVASTPSSIGYVSLCSVDSRVSVVLTVNAPGETFEKIKAQSCKH